MFGECPGIRLKEGDSLRWLSRLNWFLGRRAEADRYAAEAVAALEPLPPGPELAMAYSNRAQLAMLRGDVDSAVEWAQRAIRIAEPGGFTEILSHALNNLGSALYIVGEPAGRADLERSLSLALENRLQEHAGRAYTNLGAMSVEQRCYADASRFLEAGITYCQEHDLDSWFLYMLAWRARLKIRSGRLEQRQRGRGAGAGASAHLAGVEDSSAHDSRSHACPAWRYGRQLAARSGPRAG